MDKKDLIKVIQDLAKELGRAPLFREFDNHLVGAQNKVRKTFGTFNNLLAAANIEKSAIRTKSDHTIFEAEKLERKFEKTYKAICGKREQIQGFFRTTIDLAELFARAGNPPVLKASAQPDTHAKFVDRPAFNAYLKFLKYYQPHVHIIMGDFVDCEGLSHWPSDDLTPRRIVPEMKIARGLLEEIASNTDGCTTRIYLTGNHEHWITQAMARMPEMFEDLQDLGIEINLKTLLNLNKYGYELYPMNELVQIGRAHFTHGSYTSQHHAKKHLDVFKDNFFYGHMHDTQSNGQTSMLGPLVSASLGCLCRLDAKFLKGKPNNWQHAHGVFEFFPDGTFNYMVPLITKGLSSYNGIVFDGNI